MENHVTVCADYCQLRYSRLHGLVRVAQLILVVDDEATPPQSVGIFVEVATTPLAPPSGPNECQFSKSGISESRSGLRRRTLDGAVGYIQRPLASDAPDG